MMRRFTRTRVLSLAVTAAVAGAASYAVATPSASVAAAARPQLASTFSLHQFKHVWLIVLENEAESSTFLDPKADPYLAGTLESKGLLLKNYYATGHNSLDNYVSMTSGQAPDTDTQEDCPIYQQFPGDAYVATPGEPDQESGQSGCVYPAAVGDIGNQLSTAKLNWRGYMEDMGNDPSRDGGTACGHPQLNSSDGTEKASKGDGYATRHDPFMYYDQIIDHPTLCKTHVVAQGTPSGVMPKGAPASEHGLAWSLVKAKRTPAYSFITPNLCSDGHDYSCSTGQKTYGSATMDVDHWVKTWVPKIMKSPAYQKNGLIEITFDEAEGTNAGQACCNEPTSDPNSSFGQAGGNSGPGGGQVGMLLLSPRLRGGVVSTHPYNHYSVLRTDETMFGLPALGYATQAATFKKVLASDAVPVVCSPATAGRTSRRC